MPQLPLAQFLDEVSLRDRMLVSEHEAIRRIRALPSLAAGDVSIVRHRTFTMPTLDQRRNLLLLLYENLRSDGSGSRTVAMIGHSLVNATIDILAERQDAGVLQHALVVVDRHITEYPAGHGHIAQGRLWLEPLLMHLAYDTYREFSLFRAFRTAWHYGLIESRSGAALSGEEAGRAIDLPEVLDFRLVDRAIASFQEAIETGQDSARARALAYLSLAHLTAGLMERPLDVAAVVEMIGKAGQLMSPREDPTVWTRLLLFPDLIMRNPALEAQLPLRVLAVDVGVERFGLQGTAHLYLTAINRSVAIGDRATASRYAERLIPYLPDEGMERVRIAISTLLAHCHPDDPTTCEQQQRDIGLLDALGPNAIPALAVHYVLHHNDNLGVVDQVRKATARAHPDRDDLCRASTLAMASAALPLSSALEDESDEDPYNAMRALGLYLELGYVETALMCLHVLHDQVQTPHHWPGSRLGSLITLAGSVGSQLQAQLGDVGRRMWGDVLFELLVLVAELNPPAALERIHVLHQLAKGASLSIAVRNRPTARDLGLSPIAPEELGFDPTASEWRPDIGAPLQLSAYLTTIEFTAGDSVARLSANRRRAYHHDLADYLAKSGSQTHTWRLLGECQRALGPHAGLLSLVTGASRRTQKTSYSALLVTDQSATAIQSVNESGQVFSIFIGDPRQPGSFVMSRLYQVGDLHTALQTDPLMRAVTRTAVDLLADLGEELAHALELLADPARVGHIEQLYIWPHEITHILPFWLLPFGGRLLGDRFVVSMLPCLEVLFWTSSAPSNQHVLALASAEGGVPFGLPAEPSVEACALTIARTFGCEPVIGAEATPGELLRCLKTTSYRYVHIGAHGAQDPDAPMFHCLFLSGDNGQLFAHEILQCDLRSVRLVTLEACESVLVRYDDADSLSGLPSMLIRAGAGAVIGALWAVRPEVSLTFFQTLYETLRRTNDVSRSFRQAQQTTRAAYSQYRDWATFCLIGYAGKG